MKAHPLIVSDLIQQYADNGVGAEIGVYRGETSRHILTTTKTQMLYMVDQYLRNYDKTQWMYSKQGDPKANPDSDYENVKTFCSNQFSGRFTLLKKSSRDAAEELDVSLDFIFIDADHSYKHVLEDLHLWVPKVKPGGLIMGHDWRGKFPGVITAVIEYAATGSFIVPPKPKPQFRVPKNTRYIPAPAGKKSVVAKSWPAGNVWWALKNKV